MRVLGIEGWGNLGYVQAAIQPLLPPGAVYQRATWNAWQSYLAHEWDLVIGHSLGGDSAVRFVNIKTNFTPPKRLVLCGARYQTDVKPASWIDWFWPYDPAQVMTAPAGVPTYNFWTYGPLPSAPCTGAVQNTNVGPWYWHGSIPWAPAVQNCVKDFLELNK